MSASEPNNLEISFRPGGFLYEFNSLLFSLLQSWYKVCALFNPLLEGSTYVWVVADRGGGDGYPHSFRVTTFWTFKEIKFYLYFQEVASQFGVSQFYEIKCIKLFKPSETKQ